MSTDATQQDATQETAPAAAASQAAPTVHGNTPAVLETPQKETLPAVTAAATEPLPPTLPGSSPPVTHFSGALSDQQQLERLFLQKLLKAQAAIEAVAKDARNDFSKYNYASAESIILESRKATHSAGLVVTLASMEVQPKGVLGLAEDHIAPVYRVYDTETAYFQEVRCLFPIVPSKGKGADKEQSTARTSCLAYFLRDFLQIPRCDQEMDQRGFYDDPRDFDPRKTEAENRQYRQTGQQNRAAQGRPPQNQPGQRPPQQATPPQANQPPAISAKDREQIQFCCESLAMAETLEAFNTRLAELKNDGCLPESAPARDDLRRRVVSMKQQLQAQGGGDAGGQS